MNVPIPYRNGYRLTSYYSFDSEELETHHASRGEASSKVTTGEPHNSVNYTNSWSLDWIILLLHHMFRLSFAMGMQIPRAEAAAIASVCKFLSF